MNNILELKNLHDEMLKTYWWEFTSYERNIIEQCYNYLVEYVKYINVEFKPTVCVSDDLTYHIQYGSLNEPQCILIKYHLGDNIFFKYFDKNGREVRWGDGDDVLIEILKNMFIT